MYWPRVTRVSKLGWEALAVLFFVECQKLFSLLSVQICERCSGFTTTLLSKWESLFFAFLFLWILTPESTEAKQFSAIVLGDNYVRYDVNSAPEASGFFVAPQGYAIEDLSSRVNEIEILETFTQPDFKSNQTYWMYVNVINASSQTDWVLHISTFFIDRVEVVVNSEDHRETIVSTLSKGKNGEYINPLGRGLPLQLEKNKNYTLAIALTADSAVLPPYIGLMNTTNYERWASEMDFIYTIGIGIILGLIIIASLFWLVLRDRTFLWFAVSSLLLLFFFTLRSHIVVNMYESVLDHPPWLWILVALCHISILLFARSFLFTGSESTFVVSVFNIALGLSLTVLMAGIFLPTSWNIILFGVDGLLVIGITFYLGFTKLLQFGRYYLIFMLGWVPILYSVLELLFLLSVPPDPGASTLSYKVMRGPYIQIAHMLIHFVAMLIRLLVLKKQKYQADLRNEAKSRFLASVSHDLRQPLHSMGMFLAHLEPHIESKAGKDLYAKTFMLHSQMNDSFRALMDLSRLEAAEVTVNEEFIEIDDVLEKLRVEYLPRAQSKGLKLRVRRCGLVVKSDPLLLERILRNLLSNAIKYTDTGGVLLGCRVRGESVLVQVWDTGRGIAVYDQAVIFDIYQRSRHEHDDGESMGIGLAIVMHLANVLGHSLSFNSEEARGTKFEISLPRQEITDTHHSDSYDADNKRVMISIELLNKTLRDQVTLYVNDWGYSIADDTISSNHGTVVQLFSAKDISSDTELLDRIKNLPKPASHSVIALFSEHVSTELRGQLSALDVHVLSLPLRGAELRSLIHYVEKLQTQELCKYVV